MATFVPHYKLAKLLGASQIQTQAATVGALFAEVRAKITPEEWKTASQAAVLVNGRNIFYLDGQGTPLRPEDEVWMVFPSAGG